MKHLINQAWEIYKHHTDGNGLKPSRVHFLGGIAAGMGIITGTLPCGIPEGTDPLDVMKQIGDELKWLAPRMAEEEAQEQKFVAYVAMLEAYYRKGR